MASELFKLAVIQTLRNMKSEDLPVLLASYEAQFEGIKDIISAIKLEMTTREKGAT